MMDYSDMTIWQLKVERDKINAELELRTNVRASPSEAEGKDAVRMDYIQSRRATIYRSEVGHWVLVDETHRDRLGIIGKDLRDAVDKAMQPSLSRSERPDPPHTDIGFVDRNAPDDIEEHNGKA